MKKLEEREIKRYEKTLNERIESGGYRELRFVTFTFPCAGVKPSEGLFVLRKTIDRLASKHGSIYIFNRTAYSGADPRASQLGDHNAQGLHYHSLLFDYARDRQLVNGNHLQKVDGHWEAPLTHRSIVEIDLIDFWLNAMARYLPFGCLGGMTSEKLASSKHEHCLVKRFRADNIHYILRENNREPFPSGAFEPRRLIHPWGASANKVKLN